MIKKTKYLSQSEREAGRKHYYRFTSLNGIGFSFLGNTTVYLMAILYGANNTQLGYISSAIYISGITLLFYTRLFNGKLLQSVGSAAWFLRGLICLGYLALPLLEGQSAVFLILTVYTLFCATRTIGVAVQQNIQQMISTSRTRGEMVMTASTRFNASAIFSRIFSYFVMTTQFVSEITEILFLQILGVISNTLSSAALKKVPNREVISHTPGHHIGKIFTENIRLPRERRVLIVRWSCVGIQILTGMAIPFLRKYANFSASMIFLYTIGITLAAIMGALTIRPFADRLGSRPFILPTAIIMGGLLMVWILSEPSRSPEYFYILGFLTVMVQTILVLLSSRLFIQIIPEKDATGFTSMDVFITSLLAFFLGFTGGLLADLSEGLQLPYINIYGLTFFMGVILCLITTVTAVRFEEKGSASLKQTWTMLLSVDHLRTFRDINRLNTYNTPLKRKSLILSLGYTGSSLADDEIRQNFLQPLSQERGEIIKTLFEKKRPRLIPELIKEAENPISFNRQEAIFALGAYRQPEVKDLLLRLIHDEDDLTASNAAKSLARIGYKKHFSYSYGRFAADSTRGLLSRDLNYVIAFYNINPQGEWLESLFSKETIGRGEIYTQNFTTLVVRLMGLSPSIGWIYQKNNDSPGEGMSILLDETREIELFFTNQDWLFRSFTEGKYGLIWEWCHSILENVQPKGAAVPILKSIMSCERESAAGSDALAVIFFSYHILKNGGNL